MRRTLLAALLASAALMVAAAQAQQQQPLRMVMNTELQVLDPVITNSQATRYFGFMVFDTLIAMDSQGRYRPQMLESWEASPDQLTWTFRLREGLLWSDGTKVTAEDCIASIRRWGARDGLGTQLMAATDGMRPVDERTFVLQLSRPFGQVIEALGKPAVMVPFMMPARIANSDPNRAITEILGSGPFTFNRSEWVSGSRVVFRRNPHYLPRDEPADGLAGGKRVHFDRVDFVSMPDPATKVSALLAGEVDYLEYVPIDSLPLVRRNRNVTLTRQPPMGQIMGGLTINHAQPPFNNIRIRQALAAALNQREILDGLGLPEGSGQPCGAIFLCGGPLETDAGAERVLNANPENARALLAASGYRGERVVLLHATDSTLINPISLVVIDQLKRAGFNVDVWASDWASVAQRRLSREPVERGGWSLVPVVWQGADLFNPLANYSVAYNCGATGYPGWYCDPEMTPLIQQFAASTDEAQKRDLARRIQLRVHEHVTLGFLGQFAVPGAYRSNLSGVLEVGFPVLWNISRNAN